jgi:SRSO17 transposase
MSQTTVQRDRFVPQCWRAPSEVLLADPKTVQRELLAPPRWGRPGAVLLAEPTAGQPGLFVPQRWGLSSAAIAALPAQLRRFWARFRHHFKTRTRDASAQAAVYLQGLLLMETKRNFANIARRVIAPTDDGQALQHFMSDSPWVGPAAVHQVQQEITATPELRTGGVLLLDESAEEKAGAQSAGAGRQHNGRLGKVEMSQVGTFLAFYKGVVWTWVDGELFLPEHWFAPAMAKVRKRLGVPPERQFATKIQLGWRMIQRTQANGLPFEAVACDDLYGRSGWLRHQLDQAHIVYMAEVPADTQVYLTQPPFGVPPPKPGRRGGRRATRPRVLSAEPPVEVRQVAELPDTHFERILVRHTERGELDDPFAMRRVWTIREGLLAEEWLVIRQEDATRRSYALSNAPADAPPAYLAWLKCVRHFIERANQEAKSEAGWDEVQAQKYRAWEHQLALTILATWFIAQTKLEWSQQYARDPELARQLAVEVLPMLSVANVRELLRATMPLNQLSPEEATHLVVKHLVNRSRSTSSRLKAQRGERSPP